MSACRDVEASGSIKASCRKSRAPLTPRFTDYCQWRPWDTSRSKILSAALVVFYLFEALHLGMDLAIWRVIRFCILPLLCVWFPDELGNWTTARITRTSPRSFVWFFGWVVLLLPLLFGAVLKIEDAGPSPFAR